MPLLNFPFYTQRDLREFHAAKLPCSIKLAHSSSISMVPWSIPTNSMLIHGTALSVISVNNFREMRYARRSAKAPTNICPSFLRLRKSSVSAKNSTNIAPKFSEKNIFRAYARSRRCANSSGEFAMTANGSCSLVRVRKKTQSITSRSCSRSTS